MTLRHQVTLQLLAIACAASLLAACGSGSSTPPLDVFSPKLNAAISGLNTAAGMSNASVMDLFDAAFMDSGVNKTQVKAALDANAAALTATPDLSLFPLANITNISVTNCDGNNVCTLSGTLTNADADTTDVSFTTKVKNVNGSYVFFGDQSAT